MSVDVGSAGDGGRDFERLFIQHAPFALRILRRFGVAERDLPDACQDAFLVVHRKLPEFEGRAALSSWLYRICARTASDYRKRAHRRYETQPLAREPTSCADPSRGAELSEMAVLLERVLDRLDDDKRQVFVLYELEELEMVEVARLLGCPLKTAFSRLYAARRRVNAALARAGCAGLVVALDPSRIRDLSPLLGHALEAATPSASPLATQWGAGAATASASAAVVGAWSGGAMTAVLALCIVVPVVAPDVATGAMLVSTSQAPARPQAWAPTPPLEHVVPRATAAAGAREAPSHAPRSRPRRSRDQSPSTEPGPDTVAAPTVVGAWIDAPPTPSQAPGAARVEAPRLGSVGLDEVLSATSIRPLTRIGPQATSERWALVPRVRH